jgi:heparanase
VLASGVPIQNGLHLYAHCGRAGRGAVTLLAINNDRTETRELIVPNASERYTLEADESGGLASTRVRLNGRLLATDDRDDLPPLEGSATAAGTVRFAPATITFLSIPDADNRSCR